MEAVRDAPHMRDEGDTDAAYIYTAATHKDAAFFAFRGRSGSGD